MGVDEATAALWWPQMERMARWFIERERQWRETARAQHVELDGRIEFPVRGQPFVLSGRADRIDELHDGTLRIIDYKTGAPAVVQRHRQGLQPAAPDRGPHGGAGRLCRTLPQRPSAISCTSGCRAATRPARWPCKDDVAALAEQTAAGLKSLLDGYADPATPYEARDWSRDPDGPATTAICRAGANGPPNPAGNPHEPAHPWDTANRDQAVASDPDASVWVSAHAGSGKTHVLVNRVIRLMLAGVPPERILCLTYTRAAAAEMSRRLFDVLSSWIPLDDEALIDASTRSRAMPASAASSSRGAAPVRPGAGNAGRAQDPDHSRLLRTPAAALSRRGRRGARLHRHGRGRGPRVLERGAPRGPGRGARSQGPAAAALAKVVAFAGDQQIDALVKELLAKRSELKRLLSDEGLRDGPWSLAAFLGVAGEVSEETVWASAVAAWIGPPMPPPPRRCRRPQQDRSEARRIDQGHLGRQPSPSRSLPHSRRVPDPGGPAQKESVHESDGAPVPRGCRTSLAAECDRIVALAEMERAVKLRDASAALFGFADQIVGRYEDEKRRLGRYDYDDLIIRTLSMFRELEHAAWVLYKLDGGLDHILIDEAQDTSPEQWQIVQFLAEDFFSGEGQRPGVTRTVFAVGDRKQSIFSFQGADPDGFDAMRRHFKGQGRRRAAEFRDGAPDGVVPLDPDHPRCRRRGVRHRGGRRRRDRAGRARLAPSGGAPGAGAGGNLGAGEGRRSEERLALAGGQCGARQCRPSAPQARPADRGDHPRLARQRRDAQGKGGRSAPATS
jgi:hypothetical protein